MLVLLAVAGLAVDLLALGLRAGRAPPAWAVTGLGYLGLFCFYFATALAIAALVQLLVAMQRPPRAKPLAARVPLLVIGALFVALAAAAVIHPGGERSSFVFQSVAVGFVLAIVIAHVATKGDLAMKIGLTALAVPLLIHYYAPFALHFLESEEARYGDLPAQVLSWGQWSLVAAAAITPYCFGPRPFARAVTNLVAAAVAVFIAALGAIVLRQHMDVGVLLAKRAFGFEIPTGAAEWVLALYLVALASVVWTIVSCLLAASPARRQVGIGLALVAIGGYSFAFSLQFLLATTGLFVIARAGERVRDEERAGATAVRTPPITDAAWQAYVAALLAALRERDPAATSLTSRGDHGASTTHLVATLQEIAVRIRIERIDGSVSCVDLVAGSEAADSVAPAWSLHSRPDRALGDPHPAPPPSLAPFVRTGDELLDQRFRIRDFGGVTAQLLDEAVRARLVATFDGWLAFWPGKGVRARLHPGFGAPLDAPIPISALATRGSGTAVSPDRLIALAELLVEMAARGARASQPSPSLLSS